MGRKRTLDETPPHLTLIRLREYLWPENAPKLRNRVLLAFSALIVSKLLLMAVPVFSKLYIDALGQFEMSADIDGTFDTGLGGYSVFTMAIVGVVGFGAARVGSVFFAQVRDAIFARVGQAAVRKLALRTFEHIHRLSLRFHLERKTGALSRVIDRGIKGVEILVRFAILNLFPTVLELVLLGCIFLFYFDWRYFFVLALTTAGYIGFTTWATKRRISIRREMNLADSEASFRAVDSLINFETVKYFGQEAHVSARFDAAMARYERSAIRSWVTLAWLNSGQIIIYIVGTTVCLLLTVQGAFAGSATTGDLVMIAGFLGQLFVPLNFLGTVYREITQSLLDIQQMFDLVDQNPEIVDRDDASELMVSGGRIEFENVSFGYGPGRIILDNVSFVVPAGKSVAIVGASGAGKSTIARLLYRFYDVSSGSITIDGQDIRAVTQNSLRANIGIVPQDTVLFNETLEYNVRFGRIDATRMEVHDAVEKANIGTFVSKLPAGLSTMVGERGLKLSGGEKQRVAIARTLLKEPPILLLDEATSALDTHTERDIQVSLSGISRDRTTLMIAHRLSTVIDSDEILVLENGRIIEQGPHVELLTLGGAYSELWKRQQESVEVGELPEMEV